jgi:hypothetical protein
MTQEEFEHLEQGDIVRHMDSGDSMVVTANYGKRVTAVRTADLSNPDEWKLVIKRAATQASEEGR